MQPEGFSVNSEGISGSGEVSLYVEGGTCEDLISESYNSIR